MVHRASFGFVTDDPVELLGLGLARVHSIIKFEPKLVRQAIIADNHRVTKLSAGGLGWPRRPRQVTRPHVS